MANEIVREVVLDADAAYTAALQASMIAAGFSTHHALRVECENGPDGVVAILRCPMCTKVEGLWVTRLISRASRLSFQEALGSKYLYGALAIYFREHTIAHTPDEPPPVKRAVGAKSRNKGKRGEREACEVMRPIWPNVRRRAMQARGGSEGADLDNTPGYHVEVGCGNVNPRAKWEQAQQDLGAIYEAGWPNPDVMGATPIALTRKDRGEWLVTMSAEHFRELAEKADTKRQERQGEALGKGLVSEEG